ncbi:MAG: zf-HC2 domain-containing protein [Armatimonadetes bacterium]|nr:zf-HC2 domain-containing protein [Armatimonadota bacterium]
MNCRWVSSLISAYMDGELTGLEMIQIRRHVDGCRSCTLQYESLRNVKHILSNLTYAQPRPGFVDRLVARIEYREVPAYQRVLNRLISYGHQRLTPVAAGCAVLAAILAFLVSNSVKQPDIVALHHPSILVGASRVFEPTAPESLVSLWRRPEPPRSLFSTPGSAEARAPSGLMLTSFEGH